MALNRSYVTRGGITLELRPLPLGALNAKTIEWEKKKPLPPEIEVDQGGRWVKMRNYDDPEYKRQVEIWELEKKHAESIYVVCTGVKTMPPSEFVEEQRDFFPDATAQEMKYYWVTSILEMQGESNEAEILSNRIVGQTDPTETGVKEAEKSFPDNDRRNGREAMESAKT